MSEEYLRRYNEVLNEGLKSFSGLKGILFSDKILLKKSEVINDKLNFIETEALEKGIPLQYDFNIKLRKNLFNYFAVKRLNNLLSLEIEKKNKFIIGKYII
jgi:hypothetical protein